MVLSEDMPSSPSFKEGRVLLLTFVESAMREAAGSALQHSHIRSAFSHAAVIARDVFDVQEWDKWVAVAAREETDPAEGKKKLSEALERARENIMAQSSASSLCFQLCLAGIHNKRLARGLKGKGF